jgi:hypothetical protein
MLIPLFHLEILEIWGGGGELYPMNIILGGKGNLTGIIKS